MSIQSQIERIDSNVQSALNIVRSAGISVADTAGSDDLPAAVSALASAKPDIYVLAWTHRWNTKPAGEWSFSVYKNGVLCDTSLYAEVLWTNSANAYPKTVAGATGEFTGTKTWTANSALRYMINIYEDSTATKLLASAFLSPQ